MDTKKQISYCSNFQKVQVEVTTISNPHFQLYPVNPEIEIYVSRYDFRVRKVATIGVVQIISSQSC